MDWRPPKMNIKYTIHHYPSPMARGRMVTLLQPGEETGHHPRMVSRLGVIFHPSHCTAILGHSLLVGGWATPLKNMSSSIGMMTFPIYGKIKNVPNHQPARLIPRETQICKDCVQCQSVKMCQMAASGNSKETHKQKSSPFTSHGCMLWSTKHDKHFWIASILPWHRAHHPNRPTGKLNGKKWPRPADINKNPQVLGAILLVCGRSPAFPWHLLGRKQH